MGWELDILAPRSPERRPLLGWLDDGLRGGRRGRLRGEYGRSLEGAGVEHVVARVDGRPASHVLTRQVIARSPQAEAPIGMLGLVYTDPRFRGRGLASRCLEAAVARLTEQGAWLAALWSDRHTFYGRLGFVPAGRERLYALDAETCERAAAGTGVAGRVGSPQSGDWPELEALYAAKPCHVIRAPGYLRSLASGPDCRMVVCRRASRPVAYAARGRGDDFQGVVHEWAGDPGGVLACLRALCRPGTQTTWLTGPGDEAPAALLREAGAASHDGCFALVRPLAARAPGAAGEPLGDGAVASLFVWGFDSI